LSELGLQLRLKWNQPNGATGVGEQYIPQIAELANRIQNPIVREAHHY